MLAVFAALTSSLTVGLAVLAENILGDPGYLSQCAAGFSGRRNVAFGGDILLTLAFHVCIHAMIPWFISELDPL